MKMFLITALFFVVFSLARAFTAWADTPADSLHISRRNPAARLAGLPSRGAIWFYRFFISEQDVPTCHFNPSCSRFSMDAFETTDPFQATLITFDRLMRCNYFIYGEYPIADGRFSDPVTDHLLWGSAHPKSLPQTPGASFGGYKAVFDTSSVLFNHPDSFLKFADSMAHLGETKLAMEEYHALTGKSFPPEIRIEALVHGGWILYECSHYSGAAAAFHEARTLAGDKFEGAGNIALMEYLAKSEILNDTNSLKSIIEYNSIDYFHTYISAWSTIRQGDFSGARLTLEGLSESGDREIEDASRAVLASLDSTGTHIHKKGRISGPLSALVPGLGRVYTGRYGDAVFSFGVTGATSGLALRAIGTGPWTKAAFFSAAAAGYYAGNVYGSIISARTENHRSVDNAVRYMVTKANQKGLLPGQIAARRFASLLPYHENENGGVPNPILSDSARSDGDRFFRSGRWREAERSFRLYLFFTPAQEQDINVLYRLGKSLEYEGEHEKARVLYERILDRNLDSELAEKARLDLARLHLRNDDDRAQLEIDEEILMGRDPESIAEARYLKTWVSLANYNWEGARALLDTKPTDNVHDNIDRASGIVYKRLSAQKKIPRKSPRLARYLSMAVPGLGQAYAGKPLNGMGAFIINGSIVYSTVRSIQSENWLDAGLIVVLLFDRFYTGNLYNAERFSHEYNETQNRLLFNAIRNDVRTFDRSMDPYSLK
ncbi:membrane protein insertion efficiency factor YidD [bacterium]|nr:membrane protein insertion efficiency factor YidD [bacterium]